MVVNPVLGGREALEPMGPEWSAKWWRIPLLTGGPPLMRKIRQRHVLWVPKMGVKINIKCSKNMTKSMYPPKCLPCITGYIQTMFLPLHFH